MRASDRIYSYVRPPSDGRPTPRPTPVQQACASTPPYPPGSDARPWGGGRPPGLEELAARVERLCPSHRDPMRFFEERSEIAFLLRELASEAGSR